MTCRYVAHNSARIQHKNAALRHPEVELGRCTNTQVTREGRMMKVRLLSVVGIVALAAAMSGCVSYGGTHALITPVGAIGYHKFKPEHTSPALPPPPNADRVAAIQKQHEQAVRDEET